MIVGYLFAFELVVGTILVIFSQKARLDNLLDLITQLGLPWLVGIVFVFYFPQLSQFRGQKK